VTSALIRFPKSPLSERRSAPPRGRHVTAARPPCGNQGIGPPGQASIPERSVDPPPLPAGAGAVRQRCPARDRRCASEVQRRDGHLSCQATRTPKPPAAPLPPSP